MNATISYLIKDHIYTSIINDFYAMRQRNTDPLSEYFQCGIFEPDTIPSEHIILDYLHAIKSTNFYAPWMNNWTYASFQVVESHDHNC